MINNDFNIDQYKREERKANYIDSMHKVFINTRFDRRDVKESKIPLEILYNPKVEQIKSEERSLGIKPRSIKFVVTDNFSGGKEIDSIIQGISYTEQGKGVISYEVEGDEDKSREINYDRNKCNDKMSIARTRSKHKCHKSLQPNEISIHGLEKIKTLKPFKYPNTNENSNNESHIKSQRYVDMIRRVMSKLTELKSIKESKEKNKDNKENDDTDYIDILKDPSVLIDLMDPNFDIIKPNIDYFIEEKYNSKIENSKIAKLGKPSISSNRFFNVKKQKIFENRKHIDSKYSKYYIDPTLRFLIYLTNTELK